jgi:hypothetical protein
MRSKIPTFITWMLILIGIADILFGGYLNDPKYFNLYKIALEIYLFTFTAYLVLKHIFFYRFKGNVDVVRLIKKSTYKRMLLIQGLTLALIYVIFNYYYFGSFMNFNFVMIAILLLFYTVIVLDSHPSIYIDEQYFAYDDFFVERLDWNDIQRIDLENGQLRLVSEERDFELDFNLVDEIDYIKLNAEVEHQILDGDFASEESSRTLIEIIQNYANRYNVRLVNSMDRVI